jgi:hypothetical protein
MMSLRSIRRQCESALEGVPVPNPFDINEFCRVISLRRQRALNLVPKQTRLGPCGVWLSLPDVDYVFYEPETSQLHREHIILHELGHLLCEHQPTEVIDAEVISKLFPNLNPTVVHRVLGRTNYTAIEEQEAEMLASLVRGRVEHEIRATAKRGGNPESRMVGPDRDVLDRLRDAL